MGGMWSYRKIIQEFKARPGKSATVFLVLHELTAILSFPVVYPLARLTTDYGMGWLPHNIKDRVEGYMVKANSKVNKVRHTFGYDDLTSDHPVVLNLALSYLYVKALMPVRIGLCFYLTPVIAKML